MKRENLTMNILKNRCACWMVAALSVSLVSLAAAADSVQTNTTEYAELKTKEADFLAQQKVLEQKIMQSFRAVRVAREDATKGDAELVEMAREIAKKQAELEKRVAAKYPDLGKQAQERDTLVKAEADLRQQLRDVRKRMDIIQGVLPADDKTTTP